METAVKLRKDGHKVVIVSSGAIGVALRQMDYDRRPDRLSKVQALAAIGQCRLMSMWDQLFAHYRQPVAQILLTRNDIADRTQYLNAQSTLFELLSMGVIPIVNENDTLAVTEIKFGDNDTLSAITAAIVQAHYLFLMTDVDCLYDKNPRVHPDAKPIQTVRDISSLEADISSSGSALGTGGMSTKIVAARLATSAGVTTIITRSSKPGNIPNILKFAEAQENIHNDQQDMKATEDSINHARHASSRDTALNRQSLPRPSALDSQQVESTVSGDDLTGVPVPAPLHTCFLPDRRPIRDRYFWLLHGLAPHGTVFIDEGACQALANKAGLLPAGVVDADGSFAQQEAVRLVVVKRSSTAPNDGISNGIYDQATALEVGRALVNYSAAEIKRIRGLRSTEIRDVLGYADSEYVALRENIAFFKDRSRPTSPSLGLRDYGDRDKVAR